LDKIKKAEAFGGDWPLHSDCGRVFREHTPGCQSASI